MWCCLHKSWWQLLDIEARINSKILFFNLRCLKYCYDHLVAVICLSLPILPHQPVTFHRRPVEPMTRYNQYKRHPRMVIPFRTCKYWLLCRYALVVEGPPTRPPNPPHSSLLFAGVFAARTARWGMKWIVWQTETVRTFRSIDGLFKPSTRVNLSIILLDKLQI